MSNTAMNRVRNYLRRHQPVQRQSQWLKAGLGGLLAIASVHLLGNLSGHVLIMAPFGATCVLLFAVPESPLSQPANVIGGHLVSSASGLLLNTLLPAEWWSISLAVGLAIALMSALRITHPPAGADPIVVFLGDSGASYLLAPVLLGSIVLVIAASLFHRVPPRSNYPI